MAEDDIWDTWEDFTDCHDVDKHLEQRLNRNSNFKLENGDVSHGSHNNSGNFNNDLNDQRSLSPRSGIRILQRPAIVNEEDENRTAYAPQLKILRRPEKPNAESSDASKMNGQQRVKTLAQREAAYAEARQRIMGLEKQSAAQTNGRLNADRPDNSKHGASNQNKGNQNNGTQNHHQKRMPKKGSNSNGGRSKKR